MPVRIWASEWFSSTKTRTFVTRGTDASLVGTATGPRRVSRKVTTPVSRQAQSFRGSFMEREPRGGGAARRGSGDGWGARAGPVSDFQPETAGKAPNGSAVAAAGQVRQLV